MSFSTPPGGVPIARPSKLTPAPASSRPRLWTETADPLDVDLSDLCDRDLREDRVLDVDRDGIEVLTLAPEPEDVPHFRLPTPRPPPRHLSSPSSASIAVRRSIPPTSFVAPVAMDTVTLVAAGRPRSLSGRPSLRWAAALLVVGAGFGFVASFLSQPVGMPSEPPAAVVVTSAEQVTAETTLSFETPLDIRIPAPVPAPPSVEPPKVREKAPKLAIAQKALSPSPSAIAAKPEKTEKVAPKIALVPPSSPAPIADRIADRPVTSRVAAKPVEVNRRNIANASPEAVDALVREQLSSALR